jgi:DNA repair protein RadA/Sms
MAKLKSVYVCTSCGNQSAKWLGRCTACGEWNTYQEEITSSNKTQNTSIPGIVALEPTLLHEVQPLSKERIILKDTELNRVLGDGLVAGSVILFTGEPGIGKSTLMLQIALQFPGKKVLYVSGEESPQQIKSRADRLQKINEHIYILPETNVERILEHIQKQEPELLIIDSIQTLQTSKLDSAPGTVSQIRECANDITLIAKRRNIPTFLIGHITKDGQIAGPKVLEHMVDVVLTFEGDRNHIYRIIRSSKNRFGPSNEMGIYQNGRVRIEGGGKSFFYLAFSKRRELKRHRYFCFYGRNSALIDRNPSIGKYSSLRNAAALCNRLRYSSLKYVACRIGKKMRI